MLETVLLDRKDLPSAGAGETPIVAIAPAVGNAIFRPPATRLRSMPMVPSGEGVIRREYLPGREPRSYTSPNQELWHSG